MANSNSEVILLIGAGFSKPAHVPVMNEFVIRFEGVIQKIGGKWYEYYIEVKKNMAAASGIDLKEIDKYIPDLENLMDNLHNLAQDESISLASLEEKGNIKDYDKKEVRLKVKEELEKLIKDECIIDPNGDLKYLESLKALIRTRSTLDIYSLNYDDVIEVFCHQSNFHLEDGFASTWDSERFNNPKNQVRLFKLHGSALWYRTEQGKCYKHMMKTPERPKETITGEKLEPLIAYPVAGKSIHYAPLAFNINRLREHLKTANQCYVIGYSMRDRHIKDIFIESLGINPNLKIVIAAPDPFKIIKTELTNITLRRASIPAAFFVQELLAEGKISILIDQINRVRNQLDDVTAEAVQNHFNALEYENALRLMRDEKFESQYERIRVSNSLYTNILSGLFYVRVLSRYTSNSGEENAITELIIKYLREVAKRLRLPSDAGSFIAQTKVAVDNLTNNLKGRVTGLTGEYAYRKLRTFGDYAPEALIELKTNDEIKRFISRVTTELVKWSTEDIVLDIHAEEWMFPTQ